MGRARSFVRGRRFAGFLAVLGTCSATGVLQEARADEAVHAGADSERSVGCDAAFESAELRLRPREGRLLEARAALLVCARPSCKPWMVDDCSKRLADVEGRIPSVVFSAEDLQGGALYDVRILENERELLGRLDGRAVEMDPGPHELVAEHDGVRVALPVVVIEGRKAQQVVFAFPRVPEASTATPSVDRQPAALAQRRELSSFVHPWARPVSAGMLASGVVATGIGAGLGAVAIARKKEARCDAENVCDAGPLESARLAARAATVAFVAGGALAVGAAVTFLAFGRARVQASAWVDQVKVTATW